MGVRRLALGAAAATMVAGGLAGAAVATPSAASAAGGWTRPAVLWSSPSDASAPVGLTQVVDSQGVVTAAWLVEAGTSSRVLASRLAKGRWSRPQAVAVMAGVFACSR